MFAIVKYTAAAVFAAALTFAGKAEDASISIVVQEMPGLIEPGAQLPYNRLLNTLVESAPMETRQTILPGYRGVKDWLNHEYDCIFGGVSSPGHKLPPKDTTITQEAWDTLKISTPFNILRVHVVSMLETPKARSLEIIENRAVAVDEVLFLDLLIHTTATRIANPVKVPTTFRALDLLQSRRVTYALAYDNDIALYRAAHPKVQIEYDPDLVVLELEESVMCWPGKGIEQFISHTNETLNGLEKSGTLRQLTHPSAP